MMRTQRADSTDARVKAMKTADVRVDEDVRGEGDEPRAMAGDERGDGPRGEGSHGDRPREEMIGRPCPRWKEEVTTGRRRRAERLMDDGAARSRTTRRRWISGTTTCRIN
jgi:hypothetical protein